MSFSDNFIKKPVLTTVCSILIVLVGLIAIPTLPIANLPNIADPLIQVSAVYGGANAEVTEQAVTNPIEQQINGGARSVLHRVDQRHDGLQLDQRLFRSNHRHRHRPGQRAEPRLPGDAAAARSGCSYVGSR